MGGKFAMPVRFNRNFALDRESVIPAQAGIQ
jgi:hypothetical protein